MNLNANIQINYIALEKKVHQTSNHCRSFDLSPWPFSVSIFVVIVVVVAIIISSIDGSIASLISPHQFLTFVLDFQFISPSSNYFDWPPFSLLHIALTWFLSRLQCIVLIRSSCVRCCVDRIHFSLNRRRKRGKQGGWRQRRAGNHRGVIIIIITIVIINEMKERGCIYVYKSLRFLNVSSNRQNACTHTTDIHV